MTNVSSLSVPLVHCVPLVTGILELSSAVVVQSVGECDSEQAENASAFGLIALLSDHVS